MPRRRQFETIGLAGLHRVRAGDHVEQERQIGGRAGHRADDGEVAIERQRRQRRRGVAAGRHQRKGRLVRIDAAVKGRHPQRAADVGAERERSVSGRERGRRSAGGAAGCAPEVIGVVGGAVDLVIALPVAEPDRHVGLAEDHAAGILDARNRQRVLARNKILLRWIAPGRRQACDIVGLLHSHRDAEQRPRLATLQCRVSGARRLQAAIEIAHANRVDLAVVTFDAVDRILRKFER